ncbi:lysozyme inhibitor LprI family protein [Paraburkholderia xenovorans]|uniref:lysozyme inhibitor LprI family protein n=1 Tax=Paraburkholderia xenovorans TaxID=36873 RepID=UPI001558DD13|nr:DUF1311 domain-containing protein [Paraburkholderia xenovorans]
MKKLVPLLLVASLAACSQKPEVACNGDDAKSVVTSILKDALVKQITSDFAGPNSNVQVNVDGALIRATVDKIGITLDDVLTTKSDPNSTKKFCSATMRLAVPADVVSNADAARSMLSLNSSHQGALQAGVDFDANTVKASLEYGVQPTDDGKKIYGSTEGNNAALTFASTLVEESFVKTALERQKAEQAKQEQQKALQAQQQQAEIAQAQAADNEAALQKAQSDMKMANDAINVVWNAGSKEWRQALLPEQRLWLAQRENDCKIKALDSGTPDTTAFQTNKLNCQVQMTVDRTQALKISLQQSLSQQSVAGTSSTSALQPTLTTSFDCSSARSDAEHIICSDPELAADDVELSRIFARAKAAVTDQAAFRERTRQQWNYREQSCHDRNCLVRWYADQKTALTQIAQTGRVDAN